MHQYLLDAIDKSNDDDWKIKKQNYYLNVPLKINNDQIHQFVKNKLQYAFENCELNGFKNIIKMPKDSSMFVHNDDEKDLGIMYGMAYHINDNFDGGEVFYTNKNILHKPIANSIIIHPGTEEYTHGIHPIRNGTRYSINTFAYTNENLEYYQKRRDRYIKKALESL